MKKCALIISFALIAVFLIGSVSAADGIDANLTASSHEPDIIADADAEVQNATFGEVSKENYLVGESFDVALLDDNGTGIANKSVYFTLNDNVSQVFTDDSGVAKFALNFAKGHYTINFSFNESGFNPIQGSKDILLLSKPTSELKGSNAKANAGIKYNFKAYLTADGIPLANKKVKFVLNKKTYYRYTNANGRVILTVYLSKGTYTIKYSYEASRLFLNFPWRN